MYIDHTCNKQHQDMEILFLRVKLIDIFVRFTKLFKSHQFNDVKLNIVSLFFLAKLSGPCCIRLYFRFIYTCSCKPFRITYIYIYI